VDISWRFQSHVGDCGDRSRLHCGVQERCAGSVCVLYDGTSYVTWINYDPSFELSISVLPQASPSRGFSWYLEVKVSLGHLGETTIRM